jgi:HEAT repeat protein
VKNDPIEAALARLDLQALQTVEGRDHFRKALRSKSNVVAAKAARIAGEARATELIADLAIAFDRFLERGAAADKGCSATLAIVRALVALDHDNADLFRRGMKHVQMEATWGRSEDTAAALRAASAMGLANSRDARKLRDLAHLLADPEWPARAGAVRAIATVGSESASLLLRFKALTGDSEPEVVSDCLAALLDIEGSEALPLAASLADSGRADVQQAAVLALGASRRDDAIEWLIERFGATASREMRSSILLSLAGSRTEPALDFLVELIRNGPEATARMASEALSIHKHDSRIAERADRAEKERALRRL